MDERTTKKQYAPSISSKLGYKKDLMEYASSHDTEQLVQPLHMLI